MTKSHSKCPIIGMAQCRPIKCLRRHGPSPYISKVIGIFINMDSMVGKDFETGLASLKTIAEK
ncbi:hypothetical protein BH20PSE1_BH20PSE1_25630 [soil metagenome]